MESFTSHLTKKIFFLYSFAFSFVCFNILVIHVSLNMKFSITIKKITKM